MSLLLLAYLFWNGPTFVWFHWHFGGNNIIHLILNKSPFVYANWHLRPECQFFCLGTCPKIFLIGDHKQKCNTFLNICPKNFHIFGIKGTQQRCRAIHMSPCISIHMSPYMYKCTYCVYVHTALV